MTPTPPLPRPGYDDDGPAAWLTADEAAMLDALLCPDLGVEVTVSVVLREHRGKRRPRKLTPEQEEREARASKMIGAYARALGSGSRFLLALAAERRAARGDQ